MGKVIARIRLVGPKGATDLEALVDTGATFTKIPQALATQLGLEPKYETSVELGDGRVIQRWLALAEIEIDGVRRPVLVALGGEGEKPLVGYTTLESLGFKVDPVARRLEKTIAIEYHQVQPQDEGAILLMDGVRYLPYSYKDESELAQMVKEHAKDIFGQDAEYFSLTDKIKSAAGVGSIPDGWVVVFGASLQSYVVELELSLHDVYGHISPQIDKILAGLKNTTTQNKIIDAIYDAINKDNILKAIIREKTDSQDLHKLLADIISKQQPQLIIVIDSISDQLSECVANKPSPPALIEFATYCRDGVGLAVHVHQFEPLVKKSRPPKVKPEEITEPEVTEPLSWEADTIVVPADIKTNEDGFRRVFLNEDRWYAVRIHKDKIPQIRYIAVYQSAPVSAITHWAPVRSIEPWLDPDEPGKFVVNFVEKAREIGPIRLVPKGKVKALQNIRYTSLIKLLKAKTLDEAF